jgi:hypothetical protein
MLSELNEPDNSVSHLTCASLTSFEHQLECILDREISSSGDCEVLAKAALVLEQKAFALRLEAAKRGKLKGNKQRKKRQLGVFQGVYLI